MIKTSSLLKKWQIICWPIQRIEARKFCAMAALMFLILLNQNFIRSIKDGLVVTRIGPEVLSFIKLFIEMPVGLCFVICYTVLCNKLRSETIFRIILLFFLTFFILFGLILFPYQAYWHPNKLLIDQYIQLYPQLKWFFMMWSKWTLVCFYVMGELWPMIVFTLLYWQLANQITTIEEASRFYFCFNLVGQISLLVSSSVTIFLADKGGRILSFLGIHTTGAIQKITPLMAMIVLLCVAILLLHQYIETGVIRLQPLYVKPDHSVKLPLGLWESFKRITQSSYLALICLLTIAYSTTVNLIESVWLYEVNLFYHNDTTCFQLYQAKILWWTGIVSFICAMLGNFIMRKLGWLGAALITPVMTMVMGGVFFLFAIAQYFNWLPATIGGISSLAFIVAIAGLQNILAKGSKYSFFDATKEMTYIPLDKEMQTKGKAAVDVLGGKIGKSAGSILQVICYTMVPTKHPGQWAPLLMVFFCLISIIWIIATCMLSKKYHKLTTGLSHS
ncbi:Npt1/Npt2 family nucleotide transporter [Candidatus Cardinium hertigii]|uniref:ADP,ATP carrier protein n=1 Tax=Candidatus Cardinium hertigii TaxID=247481 RepID=A0A2Z3L9S8_9BACT|nr:NTP/NDP exchange transporter [Candidatus Cardinium hertigii]AWN82107.1 ADP,ATP carrier protein 1 [Candidatus Cardinium hertigii]